MLPFFESDPRIARDNRWLACTARVHNLVRKKSLLCYMTVPERLNGITSLNDILPNEATVDDFKRLYAEFIITELEVKRWVASAAKD
jgi:hypothetical protein